MDPWRCAMSGDHPNGGTFYRYAKIIALLKDSVSPQVATTLGRELRMM